MGKRRYVVNPDAIGRKWKNNPHNSKAIIYYVSDEVHEDKEAAKEFLKSRRKEKKRVVFSSQVSFPDI